MKSNIYLPIFRAIFIGILILSYGKNKCLAQLETFQILFQTEHFTHCYDVAPTLDQGYIITGFEDRPAPFNMPLTPYLCKINCQGEVERVKKYGVTTGLDNTDPRVATLNSGDYVMMTTVLESDYDILVVRTAPDGEAVWKKTFGGSEKDVGRGMLKLRDGHIVVNLNGQKLWEKKIINASEFSININAFPSGVYFLQIKNEHDVYVGKIEKI